MPSKGRGMKYIYLIFVTAVLLFACSPVLAAENYEPMWDYTEDPDHVYEPVQHQESGGVNFFKGWKFSGDIRTGWVSYDYSNSPNNPQPDINRGHLDSHGFYFIPKISLMTPEFYGFSAKVTGAAVTDFGANKKSWETRNFAFGDNQDPYAILQEAFVAYKYKGNEVVAGAKEISTPMVDADDWYLLSNTFQAAYYVNRMLDNFAAAFGYFYKMAGPWDSGSDGANYRSMSDASFVAPEDKENADNSGIFTAALQFDNGTHNLQLWEYYATDLYNTLFMQYDFTHKFRMLSYDAGLQFINFKEVGDLSDNDYSEIDYSIISLKFDGEFDFGLDFATGMSFYTNGPGTGETLGAWGGYPYYANGMIFHFFEAGSMRNANTYKAQVGYNLSNLGIKGLWFGTRFTYFDLDSHYSKTASGQPQDYMSMIGFRLSYKSDLGFYLSSTYETVALEHERNISGFRLIGGFTF
jgi:hypothetical protein